MGWRRWEHGVLAILLGCSVLAVWEVLARYAIIEPVLFPPPSRTAAAWWMLIRSDYFPRHFRVTLYEIAVGFALGSTIGLLLGALLATVRLVRLTLYPYIIAFQALPKVVLAPLIIAWFGFAPASKIAQATVGCFFPIFLNTLIGLSLVDDNAYKLMRSLRVNRWQTFYKLRFPHALPTIFAGVKISLTFATIGVIVAEFIATEYGLGYELTRYHVEIAIPQMYAVIVIVGGIGLALFLAVEWLDKRVVFWRPEDVERSKLR